MLFTLIGASKKKVTFVTKNHPSNNLNNIVIMRHDAEAKVGERQVTVIFTSRTTATMR